MSAQSGHSAQESSVAALIQRDSTLSSVETTERAWPDGYRADHLREHFVYRAYDAAGVLLYIGCTRRPEARLREHRHNMARWVAKAHHFRMQGPYNYRTARRMERAAIRAELPIYSLEIPYEFRASA